jgi:hypothetical protein
MTLDPAYAELIAAGQAHGLLGRPTAAQAGAARRELGLPPRHPDGTRVWTKATLEAWRDRTLDWLTDRLLGDGPAPGTAQDTARVVLGLGDVAVRDTWLVRFARADHTAQQRAVDRLAASAPNAPAQFRPPVGSLLALTEWTLGRGAPLERLAWATSHRQHPYTLADLTERLIATGVSPRAWTHGIMANLTEATCRGTAPRHTTDRAPLPDIGQHLADRGWALHVDAQLDLGHTIAWTGTLTHHGRTVADVAQHDPHDPPMLHWPPGNPHRSTWYADLEAAGATVTQGVAGLDLVAQEAPDPLATPAAVTAHAAPGSSTTTHTAR